jgi:adenylosuccinate synthase
MYFNDDNIIGICGAAWGDEGKGKFTDVFADEAHIVARAQGGCNAGHTVIVGNMKLKLHQVPSGIIYTDKLNVIGNGVVLDPRVLVENEIKNLIAQGINTDNLRISGDAHIIMPWHRIIDRAREWRLAKNKIGTTARGIGPAYADKANRCGIRLNDLYDKKILIEKIQSIAKEKENLLFGAWNLPENTFAEWMNMSDQLDGLWLKNGNFNVDTIADSYSRWAEKLQNYVTDTKELINSAIKNNKKILLEGAQGLLLDIDHGTYPFVTSSNCSAGGFATGLGISPQSVDRVYNIMSAYTTRVGAGPFPTELGTEDEISKENGNNKMSFEQSAALAKTAEDDYTVGKIIRHIAGEFGTTTGRPRRTGWFDAVACSLAAKINGPDVIITKLDVLDVMPKIKICTAYEYTGPETWYNGKTILTGDKFNIFPTDARILKYCRAAEFREFDGWNSDITSVKNFNDLPELTKEFLNGIEQTTGCKIRLVSVGPKRSQTIIK